MAWNGDYESEAYGVSSSSSTTSSSPSNDGGNDDNRQTYRSPNTGEVNTRNFNVDTSLPSVDTGSGRVYGVQSQLDEMFGPSDTYNEIGGMGFSTGGGRQSMAQMVGYAGQYSPTIAGSAYSGFSKGTGISAPNFGTATGSGGLGFADQVIAYNHLAGGGSKVGSGLSRAMATRDGRVTTPAQVGLAMNQRAMRTDATLAQQMAVATGRSYAGQVTPTATTVDTNWLTGVSTDKGGYVAHGKEADFDIARVTDERVPQEGLIGMMAGPMGTMMMGSPDLAEVTSLATGEVGSYTDMGGIVGMLSGPSVSFDNTPPDTGGGDSDTPYLTPTPVPTNIRRRFRTVRGALQQGASTSRFPRPPRPRYAAPSMYAAEGGVVQDFDYVKEGLEQKKRGYHAYAIGGKVYAVAPDRANPTQYKAYGGTIDQVKNAIGGAFGYDPQSLDLGKFPGEPGFGQDLQNFIPGVGGMTANQQFVSANGNMTVNTSDPYVQKYVNKMKMAQGGAVGFVGARPEEVEEKDTVADGVPMDVPEGTFVINAPAVEFAGSKDVEAMIDGATKRAGELGIDIEKEIAKIASKGMVPLAVSPGEVLIDPVRAKIIGYDRLEKINNRGKEEVARRTEENPPEQQGQAPIDQQMVALGGRIAKKNGGVSEVDSKAFTYPPIARNEFFDSTEYDDETRRALFLLHGDLGREYLDFLQNSGKRKGDIAATYGKKSDDYDIRIAAATDEEFLKYQENARKILADTPENIRNLYMSMHEDAKLDLLNSLQYDQDTGASEWAHDVAAQYAMIPLGSFNRDTILGTGALGIQIGTNYGDSPTPQVAVAGRAGPQVAVHEGRHLSRGNVEDSLTNDNDVNKYGTRNYQRSEFFTDVVLPDGRKLMLTEEQVLRLYDIQDAKKRKDFEEAQTARKFIVGHSDFGGRAQPALVLGKGDLSLEELQGFEDEIYSQLETLNLFGEYPEFGSRSSDPDFPYDARILPREWSDDGKRRPQSTIGSPTSDQKEDEGLFGLGFFGL